MNQLSAQSSPKRLVIRWTTLKGLAAIILFLIVAALAEYSVVLYAIGLGTRDTTLLQWSFQFPATRWLITITISPLFHLVPIAVIIALAASWTYLTKRAAVKPQEADKEKLGATVKRRKDSRLNETQKFFGKIKSGLPRIKGITYLWQKIHFARATLKSALMVLMVFLVFIIITSLLSYPQLIFQTISNAYQNNPSLLSFVKGSGQSLARVGAVFAVINNALIYAAPGFRDFALSLGNVIKPLADLDNVGKYLVFQNVAAWVSALVALIYGDYMRRGYRYKKKKRSK